MGVLDELGTFLAAAAVVTRTGASRNWYEGAMPDEQTIDPTAAIFLTGSWWMPEHALGLETTNLEFPTVQVMVRGSDLAATMTLSRSIYAELVKIGGREDLSGVPYLAVEAQQQPWILDRDTNNRWRTVCNLRVTKGPS